MWLLLPAALPACRELDSFSTGRGEAYEGLVVDALHLLRGDGPVLAPGTSMSLTLNVGDLQSADAGGAGTMTTSDGLLGDAPLLPIAPIWHDTLSGFTFPEGRLRSVLYYVTAADTAPAGRAGTSLLAVVSLMVDGSVEVRLIGGPDPDGLYGVFRLRKTRTDGG